MNNSALNWRSVYANFQFLFPLAYFSVYKRKSVWKMWEKWKTSWEWRDWWTVNMTSRGFPWLDDGYRDVAVMTSRGKTKEKRQRSFGLLDLTYCITFSTFSNLKTNVDKENRRRKERITEDGSLNCTSHIWLSLRTAIFHQVVIKGGDCNTCLKDFRLKWRFSIHLHMNQNKLSERKVINTRFILKIVYRTEVVDLKDGGRRGRK